jgi:transcriptional regulator with XRE-family HTH domain
MKKIQVKTEGQRRLLQIIETEQNLAREIGCNPSAIGHWKRGRRTPNENQRHKIELLFGIPRRAWDIEPGAAIPSVESTPGKILDDLDTLEITKQQITAIREELESKSLTDAARAKLRDTLAKLLPLRARIERDQEMLEDRVVREHPAWLKLQQAILGALEKHPEALQDVLEALGE